MSRRKLLTHFASVTWATLFLAVGALAQESPKAEDKPPAEQAAPSSDAQQDEAPKPDDKAVPAEGHDAETKPDQGTDDGEAELEKAIELKAKAKTTRDLDEVVSVCESAIAKGLDETSKKLAEAMLKSTLLDHAKQLCQRIFDGPRDSRWRFLRREALSRLEKVLKLDPKMAEAYLLTAQLQMAPGGDATEAQAALKGAIENSTNQNDVLSQALFLRAFLAEDDASKLADLNQAIIIDSSNTKALLARASYHSTNKDFDAAVTDLRAAMDQGADAMELLVGNLIASEQFDEANRELSEAIANDPKNSGLYLLRARVRLGQDKPEEALADLELGLEASSDKTKGLLLKAEILFDEKRIDEALGAVESVLKDKSDNPEALLLKARILLDQKKLDEALATVDSVLELQPGLVSGIQLRSFILAGQEKHDKAIAEMKKLVEFAPDEVGYQLILAMFYNAAKKSEAAIKIYDRVLEEKPDTEGAVRGRADAYLSLGEHAKAIQDYERAIELQGEKPDTGTVNNLAWVLATSPKSEIRDGKRSVELGLKACTLSEYKEAYAVSTLAAGYAETGDFDKACEFAAKAVELGIAEKSESLDNLRRELEGYQRKKPWRELLSEDLTGPEGEEVRKPVLANDKANDGAAKDEEPRDDKANPSKDKAEKESEDKSEEPTPGKSDDTKDG